MNESELKFLDKGYMWEEVENWLGKFIVCCCVNGGWLFDGNIYIGGGILIYCGIISWLEFIVFCVCCCCDCCCCCVMVEGCCVVCIGVWIVDGWV